MLLTRIIIIFQQIMFNSFSAEDCKKRWMFVMTHLKRHRSLSDILNDSFAWSKMKVDKTSKVKGPKKTKKRFQQLILLRKSAIIILKTI